MSTMEAELVASAFGMKETVFFSNMLTELGFGKEFAHVPLYCDNTATLHALGNRLHLDRQQPCRHRHETREQASLQASVGPHHQFRRQHQEIVLYVCVLFINLLFV